MNKIIDNYLYDKLSELYDYRNKVIHQFIISEIKTINLYSIIEEYLIIADKVRLILRFYEDTQIGKTYGIYGHNFKRVLKFEDEDFQRIYSMANDKHLLERYKRKITT